MLFKNQATQGYFDQFNNERMNVKEKSELSYTGTYIFFSNIVSTLNNNILIQTLIRLLTYNFDFTEGNDFNSGNNSLEKRICKHFSSGNVKKALVKIESGQ